MVSWQHRGQTHRRDNLNPTEQRSTQKIDAATSLMIVIGRAMSDEDLNAGLDIFLSNPQFV